MFFDVNGLGSQRLGFSVFGLLGLWVQGSGLSQRSGFQGRPVLEGDERSISAGLGCRVDGFI